MPAPSSDAATAAAVAVENVEGEAFFNRAPAEPAEKDGRVENGAAVKADEEVDDEGKHGGDDDAAAAQQRGTALV